MWVEHYFSQCVIHKGKYSELCTQQNVVRVLEKPLFCVEIKYRHWDSPDCVHKDCLPAWATYGTYSISCKLHRIFCYIPPPASQHRRCVAVTLPFCISARVTLKIDKGPHNMATALVQLNQLQEIQREQVSRKQPHRQGPHGTADQTHLKFSISSVTKSLQD